MDDDLYYFVFTDGRVHLLEGEGQAIWLATEFDDAIYFVGRIDTFI